MPVQASTNAITVSGPDFPNQTPIAPVSDSSGQSVSLNLPALSPINNNAPNAEQWIYGQDTQTQTTNCTVLGNPYREILANSVVAYVGDPEVSPQVGQTYYAMAQWVVIGLPCGGGGANVHLEVNLPPNTEFAISQSAPVRCFYDNFDTNVAQEVVQGCPQSPGAGLQGGFAFTPPLSANTNGVWPTAQRRGWRILIPIRSLQPLNGIEGNPCNSCFTARIWQMDGVDDPWTAPQVGVLVREAPVTLYRLNVTTDNPGTVVGPSGSTFPAGASITLQASDKDNFRFKSWTVNGTPRSENPLMFIMDRDYTVIAHFVPANSVPSSTSTYLPMITRPDVSVSPSNPSSEQLIGTWERQSQFETSSYTFQSDGSFEYVSAFSFTDAVGCTVSRSIETSGTFTINMAVLILKTTTGSKRTTENCNPPIEQPVTPGTQRLSWRIETSSNGDTLFLTDSTGTLSWQRN